MCVGLIIKNYRCFPDTKPLHFEIRAGFTAFVGVNNAGKSSILRFFYEFRHLFATLANLNTLGKFLRGETHAFTLGSSVKDVSEIFCDSNDRNITIEFDFSHSKQDGYPRPSFISLKIPRNKSQVSLDFFSVGDIKYKANVSYKSFTPPWIIGIPGDNFLIDFDEFSNALRTLTECLYIGAFRNAINAGSLENYFDIPIGQSFIKLWRNYKTGDIKKQNELIKRVTHDISSIFELELEINPTPDDQSLQIFVGGSSFKLNELGAGIAQFILVLGTVAIRAPEFVLIDEPELNLHPSLQLSFLTTLASYTKKGVVFSTHSIGLARATADRVYATKRVKQGESEVHPLEGIPRYAEFLGELSFNGYQELGFDAVLLVEGPTEVRTIQQFLRLLNKDHKVVLLQLGGRSMINGAREQELQELARISKHIFALIDSERAVASAPLEPTREAFVQVCSKVGIKCHVLERRATENYFTNDAIQHVKGREFAALGPYDKLVAPNKWGKTENWMIARQMTKSDLKGTDLLEFLESI